MEINITPERMASSKTSLPALTTMQEAKEYKNTLMALIAAVARQGDVSTLLVLQARYNALPPLMAGLMVTQAYKNRQAWEQADFFLSAPQSVTYRNAAHALVVRAQAMLTCAVSDGYAGIVEADTFLHELSEQEDTLQALTQPAPPVNGAFVANRTPPGRYAPA